MKKLVRESINESMNFSSYAQQEWHSLDFDQRQDILLQYVKDPDDAEMYASIENVEDLPEDIGANVIGYLELSENDDDLESIDIEDEEDDEDDLIQPEHPRDEWSWR